MSASRLFLLKTLPDCARALLLGCGLWWATPVTANVYKWVDPQGKVHYSDQPPSVQAQSLRGSPAGQAATTREAIESLDAREQAFRKRMEEAEHARAQAAQATETARIKRENCERARTNLAQLNNTPRVYTTNAAGQRTYMDDTTRAATTARNRQAVSENCK